MLAAEFWCVMLCWRSSEILQEREKPDTATGQTGQGRKVIKIYGNVEARAREGICVQFTTVGSGLVSQIRYKTQVYAIENKQRQNSTKQNWTHWDMSRTSSLKNLNEAAVRIHFIWITIARLLKRKIIKWWKGCRLALSHTTDRNKYCCCISVCHQESSKCGYLLTRRLTFLEICLRK